MPKRTGTNLLVFALMLYLFLLGITGMGTGTKMLGKDFAEGVMQTIRSPFAGLLVGLLATSIVQSSSLTTSITVGMVGSGTISIGLAIPVIMGANIGTTVTNILVSMGAIRRREEFRRCFSAAVVHDIFNLIAVLILFPLQWRFNVLGRLAEGAAHLFAGAEVGLKFTSPLKAITKPVIHLLHDAFEQIFPGDISAGVALIVVSVVMLFVGLKYMTASMKTLLMTRVETFFGKTIFKTWARAMVFGLLLTALVQSSSVTTSLIVPLVGAGVLNLVQIFPYTLGANVGTTVTALLAAFATGSVAAVTVAFAHLIFNLLGIAIIFPVPAVRRIPIRLANLLASTSLKNRFLPILYVLLIFFGLPILGVLLTR